MEAPLNLPYDFHADYFWWELNTDGECVEPDNNLPGDIDFPHNLRLIKRYKDRRGI